MIGEMIMRLFHSRTTAHVLHLKTRSYAAHKALNDYYDEIVDLVDALAEAYQGDYGLIDSYPPKYTPYDDGLKMLEDLAEWISENRGKCFDADDTYLANIVDEILALITSTAYKLRFLK